MTTTIDERVLEMRFDNSDFEKKVKTTLESLKNLKNGFQFDQSVKSVQQLEKATSSFSTENLAKNVDTIASRFSALGIVGVTALQNITNAAINAGQKLISALTIDPITTGFEEYELKMGSIQTIMASTGESLATVNAYLDELNKYSDMTIYSFSDMTTNIGKFTNAGVKLEDAVMAIKGVSNEAAVSGANANEASRAMYNFAQALSAGAVKLIDWKSIENANMATVEFKEQLLATALALGTVVEEEGKYRSTTVDANGSVSDLFTSTSMFNESLSHQWMTTEVLIETLKQYADANTEIGKKAYAAAQEIKTFSMLWDTLKEAAQSGWAETWQLIVGDFEEAKELLTGINDVISPLIDNMSQMRNQALRTWKELGGRTAMIEALGNVFTSISSVLGKIAEAFGEVFNDDTGRNMYNLTMKFKAFTETLLVGDDLLDKIKRTFVGLFTVAKSVADVLSKVAGAFLSLAANAVVKTVSFLAEAFFTAGAYIGDCIVKFKEFFDSLMELEVVKSIIEGVVSIFSNVVGIGKDLISTFSKLGLKLEDRTFKMASKIFNNIADALLKVITYVNNAIVAFRNWLSSTEAIQTLSKWVGYLSDAFNDLRSKCSNFYNTFKPNVIDAFKNFRESVSDTIKTVKDFVSEFVNRPEVQQFITDLKDGIKDLFDHLKEMFGDAWEGAKDFFTSLKNMDFTPTINGLRELRENLSNLGRSGVDKASSSISDFVNTLKNKFEGALETGTSAVDFFTKKYATFQDFFAAQIDKIDMGSLLAAGIGGSTTLLILNIANTIKKVGDQLANFLKIGTSFTDVFKNLAGVFTQMQNVLKAKALAVKLDAVGNTILKFAVSVGILAASIGVLTMIDQEKLKSSAITLGVFAGGLVALVGVLGILDKVFKAGDVEKYATVLIALSSSLMIMSLALKVLDGVDSNGLWEKVMVIGALATIMGAIVVAISKFGKTAKSNEATMALSAVGILAMATSMVIMVQALKMISGMSADEIALAVPVLITVAGIMSAMSLIASKISVSSGASLLLIAASIGVMAYAFKEMSNISIEQVNAALPGLITAMLLIGVCMAAASVAGKYAAKAGVAILAISASLILIAKGIEAMASISPETIESAMSSLTRIMVLYALLLAVMRYAGDNSLKAGVGIAAVSAGILILAAAIMILAQLEGEPLARATLAVMGLQAMFALMIASTKNAKGLEKTLIPMVAAIAVLATSVVALSLIDTGKLAGATVAMSALMVALSLLIKSTGMAKSAYGQIAYLMLVVGALALLVKAISDIDSENSLPNALAISTLLIAMSASLAILGTIKTISTKALASVAVLTLVVVALAGVLYLINDLDPEPMIPQVVALSTLLLAMSACCVILQFVNAPGAITGALGLVGLMAVVGTFMAAIGALNTYVPDLEKFINVAIPLMQAIGEGIGSFFGGAVKGFLESSADALPNLAASLTSFMENLQGFIKRAASIPSNLGSNVDTLISVISSLVGASMANNWANLGNIDVIFGGDSALVKMGKQLEELAPHLVAFGNSMKDVDVGSIRKASQALNALAEATDAISPSGGLMQAFTGNPDLSGFSNALPDIAEGLMSFGMGVSGIAAYTDSIQAAVEDIKIIGEAQDYINPTGGFIQAFAGTTDLGNFGNSLSSLGKGLMGFGTAVSGIGALTPDINSAVEAVKLLGEAQDYIDPTGGWIQGFVGTADLGNFGNSLSSLGKGIMGFGTAVTGIGELLGDINASISAIEALGKVQDLIGPTGGFIQLFTGNNDFQNFGAQLPELGKGLRSYAKNVSGISEQIGDINASVEAIKLLKEGSEIMNAIDFWTLTDKVNQFKSIIENLNSIQALTSDTAAVIASVNDFLSQISLTIEARSAEISSSMESLSTSMMQSMASGFSNGSTYILKAVGDAMLATSATLTAAISALTTKGSADMTNSGKMVAKSLRVGMLSERSSILSAVSSLLDGAASRIGTYRLSFDQAGQMLPSGLAAGIRAGRSVAINAAVEVALRSYEAAKRQLMIQSPSRRFMYLGQMSDEGMAKGLLQYSNVVSDASASVGDDMFDSMVETVNGIGKYISEELTDPEFQPKITPVLDMNNVNAGLNTIKSFNISTSGIGAIRGVNESKDSAPSNSYEINVTFDIDDLKDIINNMDTIDDFIDRLQRIKAMYPTRRW